MLKDWEFSKGAAMEKIEKIKISQNFLNSRNFALNKLTLQDSSEKSGEKGQIGKVFDISYGWNWWFFTIWKMAKIHWFFHKNTEFKALMGALIEILSNGT